MRIPGEIIALAPHPDGDGDWRLCAVASTDRGLIAGVLVAPDQGGTGQLGFHPVEGLQAVAAALASPMTNAAAGTVTTETVPARGPQR